MASQIPVFDIECVNWTQPVAVGFFDGEQYHEFLTDEDGGGDPIWDFLRFIGENYTRIRLYAHSAASYDNKFILKSLCDHGQKIRFDGGMAKLVWVETGVSFEDSYVLLCGSLTSVCNAFDVSKKLEWDHSKTENIWQHRDLMDAFRVYLKRDCIALSEALYAFSCKLVSNFGVTPTSTLALTAMKAFSKRFGAITDIASNEKFERFVRQAMYGQRNEVYRRYAENVNFYDVRSMFISCFDVPIPVGTLYWSTLNIDEGTLAEAKVKVPDGLIGPLPYRHEGRLIFPTGEFKGWWDTRELKSASEHGCDVTITRQLRCNEEPILREFGEVVSRLRCNSLNKDEDRIWKLFGLRLPGKFGQHRLRTEIKHVSEIEDATGFYPIDAAETYQERTVHLSGNRSPYIKPAISMRIQGEARIRHLQSLHNTNPVYCDTDSIHTTTELPIGVNPGELRLIDQASRAYYIKCKFYGYVRPDGTFRQKTAGFRDFKLTETDLGKLLQDGEIEHSYKSLNNWRDVLTSNDVRLIERHKSMKGHLEGSNRLVSGTETYPIRLPLPR